MGRADCVSAGRAEPPHHAFPWAPVEYCGTKGWPSLSCSATSLLIMVTTADQWITAASCRGCEDTSKRRCSCFAILHSIRTSPTVVIQDGLTGSQDSFAALYLGTRLVWSQRIRYARTVYSMGSSSRAVAGARDERWSILWVSDFGR
jgi:hypothetical protein